MAYFSIDDFQIGLDFRRLATNTPVGALTRLENAHLTPGGDLEKRYSFEPSFDVSGTFGLAAINDQIWVFGDQPRPGTLDPDINYMRLVPPDGSNLIRIDDWDIYDGKLFVVIQTDRSENHHYFDGDLVPDARGQFVRTYRNKIYGIVGKSLHFSAEGDPEDWTGTGSGFINLSAQDADSTRLTSIEIYYNQLAIFSSRTIQFWEVSADPLANQQLQVLRSTGTLSSRVPRQYASGDVLYLDSTGVRSLQARDSSNNAILSDVGSPIDKIILDAISDEDDITYDAFSIIEPLSGRYWLYLHDRFYVLSAFSASGIAGWSTYTVPEPMTDAVNASQQVFLRGESDTLYKYGGETRREFDNTKVTIETPYIDFRNPSAFKLYTGLDLSALGTWKISANIEPTNPAAFVPLGTFPGFTQNRPGMNFQLYGTHIAFRLENDTSEESVLAQMSIHYEDAAVLP